MILIAAGVYQVAIDDIPRVAAALAAARSLLRHDLVRTQSAIVAEAVLVGRVVAPRSGPVHQLRGAGVLSAAEEQPHDETVIAVVPSDALLAKMRGDEIPRRPPDARAASWRSNPRAEALRLVRGALNRFEVGDAAWEDVGAAVAALRDVVSRQCCERDNDLDGNCDVHREPWRPKV